MTYIEGLRQGSAVVARTAEKNPYIFLMELRDDNPDAKTEFLFKKWFQVIRDDDRYLEAVARHAFTNMLNNIVKGKKRSRRSKSSSVKQEDIDEVKAKIENAVLMNLRLPIGKLLCDATFADCAHAGGWFAKVAKLGKPNQIVGKVLTEKTLRSVK